MPESAPRGPVPVAAVVLLALAWLLPGLTGHDPWKQDETYIFGIVRHMLSSGDWVVPLNAGVPFMEKPPLYYWVASLLARTLQGILPAFDAARLASGLFSALTLAFAALAAREAWGPGSGRLAVLGLTGCFGLLFESHIMITDVPMLTGYTIALYGLLRSRTHAVQGGLWLGSGAGIGFLAKGLLVPGAIAVTGVLLPLLFAAWRTPRLPLVIACAMLAVLPWLVIWPVALWLRSPELFYQWFWLNNLGRFLGFSVAQLGADSSTWFWPRTLPWFGWPLWPLAVLTLWRQRASFGRDPGLQIGSVAFAVYLTVMQVSASARTAYGLPLLIGLDLLAIPAATCLPRTLERAIDWLARGLFAPAVAFSWLVWAIMIRTGHPPRWGIPHGLDPNFVMPFHPVAVTLALAGTLLWLRSWRSLPRLDARALLSTASAVTVFWLVFAMLWQPWVDQAKRFREVFDQAAQALPADYNCVSGLQLGESTRPMFDYYLARRGIRHTHSDDPACRARLVDQWGLRPPATPPGWALVWHGTRPQDDEESFWLYLRRTTH